MSLLCDEIAAIRAARRKQIQEHNQKRIAEFEAEATSSTTTAVP